MFEQRLLFGGTADAQRIVPQIERLQAESGQIDGDDVGWMVDGTAERSQQIGRSGEQQLECGARRWI